jgi:hypothetical protein
LRDDADVALAGFHQLRALDVKDSSLSAEAVARIRTALPACEILF